jgi:predicted Co/Zn/Cd cation transporter (cation efflux family)
MPAQNPERRALLGSIVATALLSVLGVLWGIAIGSQMVLFDGVFGLVGIITSALLLRASSLAGREPSRRFPYGQHSATPLVIGIQGFVLLTTLGYAAVQAPVLEVITTVQRQFDIDEAIIRLHKVGSKLYVEVDAYVAPEVTVLQEHEMRTTLDRKLKELPYEIWLNLDLLPKPGAPDREQRNGAQRQEGDLERPEARRGPAGSECKVAPQ